MRNLFSKYLYVRQYLRECNLLYNNYLTLLLSFLLSVLIFSGPIAILINLCIFNDTFNLVLAGIGFLVGLVFIMTKILFHKIVLKDHKIEGLKSYYLIDGIFMIIVAILWVLIIV